LLQQFSSSNINQERKLALHKDEPALNKKTTEQNMLFSALQSEQHGHTFENKFHIS